ncbi:Flagellar hook-associated protein 2 C-terminus [Andreprevotia lacus DSM 23236]|jgi:flagellar hook-associated protein 2|uniref:Flagellar hook-associated protein 2 n=1 Tax=Andreprevotia lacus DSM 23236 TaxID=1121001 RepID=A0A1W1XHH0_9NEIS|nr:flagellar filament capping protein FliD [Andreprevotia lacus]SMC23456.1 Flagellar hook-associated protein 2 C-terminus [Andreprevotia lacus DSM 23236]
MASITSAGIGSGLDIEGIITSLMNVEKQPLTVLTQKSQADQTKISALGSLQSSLSTFQARVISLSNASTYKSVKGTLGDSSIGTVSTTSLAQAGSYSLSVTQLAQNQKLKTDVAFGTVSDPVGQGTLTIQFGSVSGGSFLANGNKGAFDIKIDSTNNTLTGLRDAINAKNAGVSASIINDGTGFRLLLSSTDSGSTNGIKITAADSDGNNTDASGLSRFTYDPTATDAVNQLTQTQAAQDAKFTLDGIDIVKSSNTVTDVLQGVTLNLSKISALDSNSKPVTTSLNIARDTSGITQSVQDFVKAYNDFTKSVNDLSFYNADATDPTQKAGVLNGDYVVRSLQSEIRGTLNQSLGSGSYFQGLSAVGINMDWKTGNLSLDTSKLNSALSTNPNDVANLFAVNGSTSNSQATYIGASDATKPGTYAISVTTPATRAKISGVEALYTKIDASNQAMSLTLGSDNIALTLSNGNYTRTGLAAQIKQQLQAQDGSSTFTVNYNATSGKFDISRVNGSVTDTQSVAFTPKSALNIHADSGSNNGNDTLMVAVDGVSSGQIQLTQGDYSSPAALAAEMQSKINGDSALKKAGVSVTVTYNDQTGAFDMQSNRYGSASNVQITSVGGDAQATYGLKFLNASGTDVAGTINGETATGSGQMLTGAGNAQGLQVSVTATIAGDLGSVSFSRGFASRLDQTIDNLMSSNGLLQSRINGLKQDMKDIDDQGKTLNTRLADVEKRYRAQYTALDSLVASMKNTSSFLTSQLASLSSLR